MPFQVSPGVNVSEIDLTTAIPAVSTSIGAFAGSFQWGPAEVARLVTSEVDLVNQFYKPSSNTAQDFFTAANFLAYSNALRLVRIAGADAKNASDNSFGAVLIKNDEHWDGTVESSVRTNANTFYAKYPGALGNEITVELCDTAGSTDDSTGFANWYVNTFFDAPPTTSTWVSDRGGSNDELHVAIIDSPTGHFSGTANAVLELYPFLSKAVDARNSSGDLIHWKTYINNNSEYIRIGDETTAKTNASYGLASTTAFGNTTTGVTSVKLAGGYDGNPTAANYQTAYDIFSDADQEDVGLIMAGSGGDHIDNEGTQVTVINHVIDLATTRKDCVAFYSPHYSDVDSSVASTNLADVKTFRESDTNRNTSYAFMDSGWKYQYDKYSDVYRWIPLNGDIAGLVARTDNSRDAWFSPAGYNRGQIKNIVRLAYNPSKAHRDALYQKQINPVVSFPGQGTILFGDKTSQTRPSAFDRINVRRLFIVLEKAISTAAKYSLFEFNDAFTRAMFRNMVEPFLRDVQGRRGINDFRVVCDETNNPGSVIDRNEFVGDIYIKPVRSINFIQLNFVAVSTGVDFNEVVGQF